MLCWVFLHTAVKLKTISNFMRLPPCVDVFHVLFVPLLPIDRVLGKGSFATVKLAVKKSDGTKWAVKVIEKTALSQEDEEALKNEVQILEVRRGVV